MYIQHLTFNIQHSLRILPRRNTGGNRETLSLSSRAPDDRGRRSRAGSGLIREAHHRAQARQRSDRHRHGASRSSGLFVRHVRERRIGPGSPRHHRPGPHVRAHGLQRLRQSRHLELRGRARGAAEGRRHLRRLRPRPPRSGQPRRRENRGAGQGVEGGGGRRQQVRRPQRVQQDHRPRRRHRRQRLHRRRRDGLLLLHALEPGRAVGLPRLRPLPPPRLPRVLQRARRGLRGTPHAH